MKGRERSGEESGNGFQLWCDSLPGAQAEWGGQAGDEKMMRMERLDLAQSPGCQ